MKVNTRVFGEIDIADDKIIHMEKGIIGFPELKRFAMVHNSDRPDARISWFVSMDEPTFALPVMDPLAVKPDYNPSVEDELFRSLGNLSLDNTLVLVTISLKKGKPEDMTVNLKAPIVINADECKGCQVILEDDYPIKYPVYEILKKLKG